MIQWTQVLALTHWVIFTRINLMDPKEIGQIPRQLVVVGLWL
jgi:hypothetical protein